jgi:S1-C subfamily serine protease
VKNLGEFKEHYGRFSSAFLLVILLTGLLAGSITTYYIAFQQISSLRNDVSNLNARVSKLWGFQNVTYQNITIYQNITGLTELYERVKDSAVLIYGKTSTGAVQGSGFVYNFTGIMVVITNYHVVHGTTSISVTFSNGNGYSAKVNGTDPYADLAVLLVDAPENEFKPLEIVGSSTLRVGDPVIAIGNPYGLVGSLTTGVISALNRTITEEYTGGFGIANIIQTSAPINPGNSGGPLLNYCGKVVGITTAIVEDSQGLGFAIPSNAILREIASLVLSGTYEGHSYLGITGTDMNYEIAQTIGTNITYGWLITKITRGEPADKAGLRGGTQQVLIAGNLVTIGGDIIVALNGSRIRNGDDLATYLEENTLPRETLIVTVVRGNLQAHVTVTLGARPSPPV